jgi:serine/threonine protein kinase
MRVEGDSGLTQTGQIVGTPSYMPPEQAQGKRSLIGPGSDVYSLGAILYECLTGRAPFRADSVMKTIEQVIHRETASPRLLNSSVPRDLETICLKCLEKEPHRRYGTAQLLADDLRRDLDDRPILARPVSTAERTWRWCRRNPAVANLLATVAVCLIAGIGVSTYFATEASNRAEAETFHRGRADEKTKLAERK